MIESREHNPHYTWVGFLQHMPCAEFGYIAVQIPENTHFLKSKLEKFRKLVIPKNVRSTVP